MDFPSISSTSGVPMWWYTNIEFVSFAIAIPGRAL
jgi:hypothetical protein